MSCSENKGERGNNEISLCKNDKGETEKKKGLYILIKFRV